MLKHQALFILFFYSVFQMSFLENAMASAEVAFSRIVTLSEKITNAKKIEISVYIDKERSWKEGEVIERLEKMNESLAACQLQISNVYVFHLKLSEVNVRIDDVDFSAVYYDGMRAIAKKSQKITPIQFFYIENFLNPSPSHEGRPYVIPSSRPTVEVNLQDSIWFPHQLLKQKKSKGDVGSVEALQLGALFLNSPSIGNSNFTNQKCEQFKIPRKNDEESFCGELHESLNPLFSLYYNKFGQNYYMSLYCVRNSQNLYQKLIELYPEFHNQVYNVLMIHKDPDKSLIPQVARGATKSWSNHSFLVVQGLVLDLDYSSAPQLLSLSEYLEKMWGSEQKNIRFLWRPAYKIGGYTNLEVRKDFQSKKYPVGDLADFLRFFSKEMCF